MRHHVVGVAGVLAALAVAGCTDSKSVLHVGVTGDVQGLYQLVVNITAGSTAPATILAPSVPRAITLPTSFNVEMDRSRTGALDLTIAGNDEGGNQIASGSGHLDDIVVGGLNTMEVALAAAAPPGGTPDAGGGDEAGADAGDAALDDAGDEVATVGDDDGGADAGVAGDDDAGDDASADETGP